MRRRLARTLRVLASKIDTPAQPSLQQHQRLIDGLVRLINDRTLQPPPTEH
jgi:hypothetical protein